jgi:flagellar basal-body rod protein FlgB
VDVLARDVTFAALAQTLDALSLRQTLIAQNIANVSTPGYKRRDISFTEELAAALGAGPGADSASDSGTAEAPDRAVRVQRVMHTVAHEVVEENLFYRADMGGVDLDREMAEQAKTSMMYAAMSQLAHKKIQQYQLVIRDGRM